MRMRICIPRSLYDQKKTETASNSSQAERWLLLRGIQSLMSPVALIRTFLKMLKRKNLIAKLASI
jgi:hypothetical protein